MPEQDRNQEEPGSRKKYHFFVDGKKFETDKESITGAEIKNLAGVDSTYQLFEEGKGNDPDRPVSDLEGVHLGSGPRQFFAVPPATFGAQ
jgi:hypothetical protein